MTEAPKELVEAVDAALATVLDTGPRMHGVAEHLRAMGMPDRADMLTASAREIEVSVQQVRRYLRRRGGDLRDIATAILALRDGFHSKFLPFADMAGELREAGLDAHAAGLERFIADMLRIINVIHIHAGVHGMLDDTMNMTLIDV